MVNSTNRSLATKQYNKQYRRKHPEIHKKAVRNYQIKHTKNNISVISLKANRIKNNATIGDLEKVLDYMKKSIAPSLD